MKTILSFLVFFVFFFFLSVPQSLALDNFSTSYNITYTLSDNADTHATMDVALTNNTTDYYASSYSIHLGFPTIKNLKTFDTTGNLRATLIKTENGYTINIPFNSEVVGYGKKRNFTMEFDTPDIAKQQGSIWEVNIPGLENQESITNFTVTLSYPSSYGKPAFIKPAIDFDPNNTTHTLTFTKDQLGSSGISISFGSSQVIAYQLTYHIKNTNLFPIKTEIALPPTTQYQEITLDTLDPEPLQVTIDTDGNWLAEYSLAPSESKDIIAKGSAILFLNPKQETLSTKDRSLYLAEKQYWNTTDPKIKEVAKTLHTPRDIYNYVVETLSYDYSRVTDQKERLGAKKTLANPTSAVCLEFTDLFIALARASGIPAREVDGYAFTENSKQRPLSLVKDILHAWPEYYDDQKQAWIMVDPTWGNTTGGTDYFDVLDFDHFAFVKKGKESTYPIPAGGYKYNGAEDVKDVVVSMNTSFPQVNRKTNVLVATPNTSIAGLPVNGAITIVNTGNALSTPNNVTIFSSALFPKKQIIQYAALPPFGHIDANFSLQKTSFFTSTQESLTIQSTDQTIQKTIIVSPFFLTKEVLMIGGGILVVCIVTVSIVALISRRVSVSQRT